MSDDTANDATTDDGADENEAADGAGSEEGRAHVAASGGPGSNATDADDPRGDDSRGDDPRGDEQGSDEQGTGDRGTDAAAVDGDASASASNGAGPSAAADTPSPLGDAEPHHDVSVSPVHPRPATIDVDTDASPDTPLISGEALEAALGSLSRKPNPLREDRLRHHAEIEALSWRYLHDDAHTIDGYEALEGYAAARRAVHMPADDIIQLVKDANVRGRGGAGFPTGLKWSFVAKNTGKPSYLVCNADESEPGTFKDRPLLERDPHSLVEGMIVGGMAINAEAGYIYCRGEFGFVARRLRDAIAEAYDRGYLGENVFNSGKRFDLHLHRGAAAYICGEETALLESLEGRRGQPRLRPPFPAVHGLYGCPTTVNNVETIVTVPYLIRHGADWYKQWGTEKSTGPKLMCISGEVKHPGNYEVALGTRVSDLIDMAGGMLDGRELKFWCPGGSSTPYLTGDHVDLPYSFEDIQEAGSLLGTGALMLYSDRTSVVETTWRYVGFYKHESCGKCTPCREGGYWIHQVLGRILSGHGRREDLQVLDDTCNNIFGRSFCALGDALTSPVQSSLKYFRDEYEYLIDHDGELPPGVVRTTDPAYFTAPPVHELAGARS